MSPLTDPAYCVPATVDYLSQNALITGEGVYDRRLCTSQSVPTSSQVVRLTYFTAQKTETITTVKIGAGGTGAGATPSLLRIGIWTANTAGALLALVGSTASDTTLLATQATVYSKALQASWAKVAGQRYAAGILVVTAATAPTVAGTSSLLAGFSGTAPRVSGAISGQADLPASALSGGVSDGGNAPYFEFIP